MEINYGELRRQSRIAAWLTGFASILVLGSLLWSTLETRNARRDLGRLAEQKADLQSQVGPLESRVRALTVQKQELEQADTGQSAALNALVNNNVRANKTLEEVAKSNPIVAQAVPRIFIHQSGIKQVALQLAKNLRSRGFVVLAPDEKPDPYGTRIVYFNAPNSPETNTDIEAIKQTMKNTDSRFASVWVQLDNQHRHPNRTYTVWIQMS